MKYIFVLVLLTALHCQCFGQIKNGNYLDSLNNDRGKPLWIVHFSDSSSVSTYNLIFLRENVESEKVQTLVEMKKLHPFALGVEDVYPKKNTKFLTLKELCLNYKIPIGKMELPVCVDSIMIEDPADILIESKNIKSCKMDLNKESGKNVIRITTVTETEESRMIKRSIKYFKDHPDGGMTIRLR